MHQVCGAGVEAPIEGGEDLLKFAAEGDLEGVQAALAGGADVNYASEVGETALHLSSIKHSIDVAKALVDAGANVDLRTTGDRSLAMAPLHWWVCRPGLRVWGRGFGVKGVVFRV